MSSHRHHQGAHPGAHDQHPSKRPDAAAAMVAQAREQGLTLGQAQLFESSKGIGARARSLSEATVANMKQNLGFAFLYNALGVPIAAGALYPALGLLLSPLIAALAMSLSSVSVVGNALRLRKA